MELINLGESRITTTADIDTEGGFSASMIRKALVLANPTFTKKEIRMAVTERLKGQQALAHANMNEAVRRGYTYLKQTVSKSGRMQITLNPPSRAKTRAVTLCSMSTEAIEAELVRRRSVAVA